MTTELAPLQEQRTGLSFRRPPPGTRTKPMLLAAVGSALLLQLVAVYVRSLRDLLGTEPVAVTDLLIVGATATLGYAAIRLDRLIQPRATLLRRRRWDGWLGG